MTQSVVVLANCFLIQVIFTDEHTLIGPYFESSDGEDESIGDIVEEDEEEMQIPSTKASTEVLDNSQQDTVCLNQY